MKQAKQAKQTNEDTFVFCPSFYQQLCAIKDNEVRLRLYEAVAEYGVLGTVPDFTEIDPMGLINGVFAAIKYVIDSAKANRGTISNVRSKAGKNGGAPKSNQNARKHPKTSKNKQNKQDVDVDVDVNIDKKLSNESKESADKPHKAASKRTAFVAPPTENCSEDFLKFQQWVADNAPRVSQMKEPMTEEQLRKLKGKYSTAQISDVLLRMHNYRRINDNISAYLTALNWLGRSPEFNNLKPTQQNEKKRIYKDL